MRTGSVFLVIIAAIIVATAAAIFLILRTQKPAAVRIQDAPMVAAEDFRQTMAEKKQLNYYLAGVMVVFSLCLQVAAWWAATKKLGEVKRSSLGLGERTGHLDAIEVYFDLPLYFGLLGTVLSFVLVTIFPEAGLMFAYISTALGIIVSVILHLAYLTPYRQQLISARDDEFGDPKLSDTSP